MATEREIAGILGAISQNLKALVAAEVANALFQQTGKIPEQKKANGKKGIRADHQHGPRPPGPRD